MAFNVRFDRAPDGGINWADLDRGLNMFTDAIRHRDRRGREKAASEALSRGDYAGAIKLSEDPEWGLKAKAQPADIAKVEAQTAAFRGAERRADELQPWNIRDKVLTHAEAEQKLVASDPWNQRMAQLRALHANGDITREEFASQVQQLREDRERSTTELRDRIKQGFQDPWFGANPSWSGPRTVVPGVPVAPPQAQPAPNPSAPAAQPTPPPQQAMQVRQQPASPAAAAPPPGAGSPGVVVAQPGVPSTSGAPAASSAGPPTQPVQTQPPIAPAAPTPVREGESPGAVAQRAAVDRYALPDDPRVSALDRRARINQAYGIKEPESITRKGVEKYVETEAKERSEALGKAQTAYAEANKLADTLKTIKDLQGHVYSGTLTESVKLTLTGLASSFGIANPEGLAPTELHQALVARVVQSFGKEQSGALSDKDIAFIKSMGPTESMSAEAQSMLVSYMSAAAQRQQYQQHAATLVLSAGRRPNIAAIEADADKAFPDPVSEILRARKGDTQRDGRSRSTGAPDSDRVGTTVQTAPGKYVWQPSGEARQRAIEQRRGGATSVEPRTPVDAEPPDATSPAARARARRAERTREIEARRAERRGTVDGEFSADVGAGDPLTFARKWDGRRRELSEDQLRFLNKTIEGLR